MKLAWRKLPDCYMAFGKGLIPYVIERVPYGTKRAWELSVNDARVPLTLLFRLRDVKEKAQALEDET